jgi:cell division protein ftsA
MKDDKKEVFFALDIGTGSIMGILGERDNEKILIKDVAVEVHKKRAMYDGQIHDIDAVAQVAEKVKNKLEEQSNIKLTEVAIAAAGRSLKTINASVDVEFDDITEIDAQIMKNVEAKSLQEAANMLKDAENDNISYYNVGHTVMTYKLDGYEIKNPVGHKGNKISLEVIATFLPKIVVEALNSVMNRINLTVSYMTLEPIVAIEVSVPENVRLLNIAMVDIGAGTSDIAVTKDGSITGYAMTSTAGDEITESISQNFLLDFNSAERLKCNLCNEDTQVFTDIVGIENKMTSAEILDRIKGSISLVAKNIADEIIKLNEKAPSAVFLVGGGSLTPGIGELIAEYLQIPSARVVIKSVESIADIENNNPILQGPQCVTPVGILSCSIKNEKQDFIRVKVNGKNVKMFRSVDLKISDALLLAGFNPRELISRRGKSLLIDINGEKKLYNGEFGEESKVYLNEVPANIDFKISDGDEITVQSATKGKDAYISVKDIVEEKLITVNGEKRSYYYNIIVNGETCTDISQSLNNGDNISYDVLDNSDKLRECLNISKEKTVIVNGDIAKYNLPIMDGDTVEIEEKKKAELSKEKKYDSTVQIICNGKLLKINSKKEDIIFVDIFDHIDFDRSRPHGSLTMKINGKDAGFTDILKDNDNIQVYWNEN